jgi:hypothetical protein
LAAAAAATVAETAIAAAAVPYTAGLHNQQVLEAESGSGPHAEAGALGETACTSRFLQGGDVDLQLGMGMRIGEIKVGGRSKSGLRQEVMTCAVVSIGLGVDVTDVNLNRCVMLSQVCVLDFKQRLWAGQRTW